MAVYSDLRVAAVAGANLAAGGEAIHHAWPEASAIGVAAS